jgi:NADPH:quinone reductase-like Zn-dependent oxidoreductase
VNRQPGGRLFGTSANPRGEVPLQQLYRKGVRVFGYGGLMENDESRAKGIRDALLGLANGEFEIVIDSALPLDKVNTAFGRIVERSAQGKLVLDLSV